MFHSENVIKQESLLHKAVATCSTEELEHILDQGSEDIDATGDYGRTPLHCAIEKNFDRGVNLLLKRGAKVDVADSTNHTPLHYSCKFKSGNTISVLLDKGANVDFKNHAGRTPLHLATLTNFEMGINLLLDKGANLNAVDREGNTPLHLAVRNRNKPLVEILLNKGAELEHQNNKGYTSLHIAARQSDKSVVSLLVQEGADVSTEDYKGCTPLHLVLQGMQYDDNCVVEELLDWGGSMLVEDEDGDTPLVIINKQSVPVDGLKRHVIKSLCANLPLEFSFHFHFSEFNSFQIACSEEVAKLKRISFSRNSLFDIFSKSADPTYVMNDKMEQAIKSSLVKTEFPIYCSLLRAKFECAKKRVVLLDGAQSILNTLLPNEICRKILSYLTDRDLEKIANVRGKRLRSY